MSGNQFVDIFGENQIADLRTSFDGLDGFALQGVPELNASVLGATTRGEQSVLVRRPCDGFDGSLVLGELRLGHCGVTGAPYEELAVVAP